MKSKKCPNCGAPVPHMEQGVDYNCSYCNSAIIPSRFSPSVQNTLDKISGAKTVEAKPVYAPGRYAALALAKVSIVFLVALFFGFAHLSISIIVLLLGSLLIYRAVYWVVKWRAYVKAQASLTEEQRATEKRAIEEYYNEQNKAGEAASNWIFWLVVCVCVLYLAYLLDGAFDKSLLNFISFIAMLGILASIGLSWKNIAIWVKEPNEMGKVQE